MMEKLMPSDIVPMPLALRKPLISGDNEQIRALKKWEKEIGQKILSIKDEVIGKGGRIFRVEGSCHRYDHGDTFYIYADSEDDAYKVWDNRIGEECCIDSDSVDVDEINIAPFLGIKATP